MVDAYELEAVRQRVNRERLREQELKNRLRTESRKKRNHTYILIAAEMLRFYGDTTKQWLIEASDDDVKRWVQKEMKKIVFSEKTGRLQG